RRPDFLLNVDIPYLYVAEPVIEIDGIVVCDSGLSRCQKALLQRQLAEVGLWIGLRNRKRRLKRKLLGDGLIGAGIVVNAIADAYNCFGEQLPRQSQTWGEIVAVGTDQCSRKVPAVWSCHAR